MTDSITIETGFGNNARQIVLAVGQRCRIAPLNPRAMKHRGRVCVIESFDNSFTPSYALARFDDTKRVSKVDVSDLEPLD